MDVIPSPSIRQFDKQKKTSTRKLIHNLRKRFSKRSIFKTFHCQLSNSMTDGANCKPRDKAGICEKAAILERSIFENKQGTFRLLVGKCYDFKYGMGLGCLTFGAF